MKKNLACSMLLGALIIFSLSGCRALLDGWVAAHDGSSPAPQARETPVSCPDVELIGLFDNKLLDVHTYVAKIRNKAPYTKNVTIEWVDKNGQRQRSSFDVAAGQMIDGRLTTEDGSVRPPQNLRIVACM